MKDPTHQNAETALYSVRSREPWKMLREGSGILEVDRDGCQSI